jgi:hypothetical protein
MCIVTLSYRFVKIGKSRCLAAAAFPWFLERREVEKRIYGVKDCGSRLPPPFMLII